MSGPFGSSQWMYNAGGDFYDFPISNSLRFEDGDSAYLSKTPSSASNRRTFTISKWVKRGNFGTRQNIFSADSDSTLDGGTAFYYEFQADNALRVGQYQHGVGWNWSLITSQVFRDASSWYHITISIDTTQGTASNRCKIYVNGQIITAFSTENYPSENYDNAINTALPHFVGKLAATSSTLPLDGYLADVNFIDGLQLTPSSFGETKNDIWIPKDTSGLTFGTNGFRQQYKQVGTGTASSTTIGADTSGNDNHWTSTNLVASDVVPDSPTNNFATLNPLNVTDSTSPVFSQGNLKSVVSSDGSKWGGSSTISAITGKYYFEVLSTEVTNVHIGVADETAAREGARIDDHNVTTGGNAVYYRSNEGHKRVITDGSQVTSSYAVTYGTSDIIGVAFDVDGSAVTFYKNNSSLGAITIPTTTESLFIAVSGGTGGSQNVFYLNAGQDSSFAGNKTAQGNADGNGIGDFYYAPPSGFLALCTANLPAPVETIDPAQGGSPQDYFNTVTYTGTGAELAISGVGFSPDWTWIKKRSGALTDHRLFDTVRGATKSLKSNLSVAEATESESLKSFDVDGFTLGTAHYTNSDGETHVAWNWKVGGSSSVNTDGTDIDSTGVFNTDLGMSIVTYTGTGSSGDSYGHGLDKAPELVFVKDRTDPANWAVYSVTTGLDGYLRLNDTNTKTSDGNIFPSVSATTIGVGTQGDGSIANTSGDSYVSYNFHSVDGYSKIGSYTGNGSTDGPFVYTGFRPAYVMFKRTNATGSWRIMDNKRDTFNVADARLLADTAGAETTDRDILDMVSNGFKFRRADAGNNGSGDTYIYMAFAEQPTKYANAR